MPVDHQVKILGSWQGDEQTVEHESGSYTKCSSWTWKGPFDFQKE